ncbi:unnamed protein product [Rotaria sp. Silwood2]|nr:unnamed protein product [Rotaria sp. Silwood2]
MIVIVSFRLICSIKNISLSSLTKKKFSHKSLSSIYNKTIINENIRIPQYSESFISNSNISKTEKSSFNKDFNKQSSIYSNDHPDSSSSIEHLTSEFRQRTQLTYLLSLDFVQSSANFIYPNLRIISSGYFFHRNTSIETNSIYMYSNTLTSNKILPLVLLGSEYFLRKPINFEHLKFPFSTNENIEPLVDLFINPVHPSQSIDRSTIDNITTLATERVSQKRTNQSDHHLAAPNEIAFNIQEDSWMENDILRFICPFCKFFFQEPYELECGHQQCKSCINHNNICATCSKFILKDKARFDPCFQNEMQEFLSMCPKCKWGERWIFYQKHLNQNHQQFTNCSICNKQEAQSSSYEHYLNGMHQNNVKIIILDMQ